MKWLFLSSRVISEILFKEVVYRQMRKVALLSIIWDFGILYNTDVEFLIFFLGIV